MSLGRRCEIVALDEVYELSFELSQLVRRAGFEPELVVAVARGGFAPARFVCDFLRLRDLTSLGVRHYAPGARREAAAQVRHPLAADVEGRRVLVVDDVNDSGETIEVARAHLAERGAGDVRVAVLHEKRHSRARAEFRAVELPDERWLVYQWAVVEDAIGFLEQMDPPPQTPAAARERLAGDCGLELGDLLWSKVQAVWSSAGGAGAR